MTHVTQSQADGPGMPLRSPIRLLLGPGEVLSDQELREMWSFRIGILRLKPHVSPEEDLAGFCRFCRRCTSVLRLRSSNGELCGILVVAFQDGTYEGQHYRLLLPEYGMMDARLRGSALVPWAALRLLLYALWNMPPRQPGARLFLGGVGYPTSALLVERLFPPLWLHGDEEAPPLATHLLEWIRERLPPSERWEPEARRVSMPTIPQPPSERWLARQRARPLYQRYVQRCPDWAQGYALPLVAPVSWRVPLLVAMRMLQRQLGER
ncbi:MAG TPA: hypothetical protein VLQ93_10955 [Myxococcaceae bacterium]|nr:hypothetical protein [Myxococcaceae bacterium]